MRIPYIEVKEGVNRPLLALAVWGAAGPVLTDGILDTGADRVLLAPRWARPLGLDLSMLPTAVTLQSATGQRVLCKTITLAMQLRRARVNWCWQAELAIAIEEIRINHWGHIGFLEYFRANFDGPNRLVTLTPGRNLPKVKLPV